MKKRSNPYDIPSPFRWTDIPTGIALSVFVLIAGITAFIFIKPLYYLNISWLDIPGSSNTNAFIIKENYRAIIDYLAPFSHKELNITSIRISEDMLLHLSELKHIIYSLLIIGIVCAIVFLVSMLIKTFGDEFRIYKVCGIICSVFTVISGVIAAFFIRPFMLLFHDMFFTMNEWLNTTRDTLLQFFPEMYFREAFILIAILELITAAVMFVKHYLIKRRKKEGRFLPLRKNYYY